MRRGGHCGGGDEGEGRGGGWVGEVGLFLFSLVCIGERVGAGEEGERVGVEWRAERWGSGGGRRRLREGMVRWGVRRNAEVGFAGVVVEVE